MNSPVFAYIYILYYKSDEMANVAFPDERYMITVSVELNGAAAFSIVAFCHLWLTAAL